MKSQENTRSMTARRIMSLVVVCFFFSGMSGLMYEILWTRMVGAIIGGAPFAISIVLTIFMGGLGLGSYLAGRTMDRVSDPLKLVRIYGFLELIVGAYGLVLPLLLAAFRPLYAVLYNHLYDQFMLYSVLTFIGCSILLLIPVTCMGATLPILCRFTVTRLSHLGTQTGRLYGLNTVGAAFGALFCGFWLIYLLGIWGSLAVAIAINTVIGLVCVTVSRKVTLPQQSPNPQSSPAQTGAAAPPEYAGAVSGALVIFAVSGFCAMACEVIWTKLLGLVVAPTTYSFTIVLVTFILGLALGAMFFGWLGDKTKRPVSLLIFTQIAAALMVLAISQILGNSQFLFARLILIFQYQFGLLSVSKAAILFVLMVLPTLCFGATFPLVGKIYTQSVSKVAHSIGFAYAINTAGAVLGSFGAGFVLIPLIGKEKGLSLVVALQLVSALCVAAILFVRNKEKLVKWLLVSIPAVAGLFLSWQYPVWDHRLLAEAKYHRFNEIGTDMRGYSWWESLVHGPQILRQFASGELLFYGDGIGGFTTVQKYAHAFGDFYLSMANSGKVDASTRGDMKTQTLLAHFGMLFHPNPRSVMVVGLASGITAGEVLNYPIDRLDVIEINEQVVAASDLFLPWNNHVLSNPKTALIIQDARAHLRLTDRKYDVIISEPSNPWMAGLAALFTKEFFENARDRLNDGGIFVQFIHAYQMDWPTFAMVGRTFAQVYPNSLMTSTSPALIGSDYLLIGINGKDGLALDNAVRRLPYLEKSKNLVVSDARLLYRLIVSEDLTSLFGPGPVNTDSRPRLEYAAPKLVFLDDKAIWDNIAAKRTLSPLTDSIQQEEAGNVDAQLNYAAFAVSLYSPFVEMVDLAKATPAQKERFFSLMDTYYATNSVHYSEFEGDSLAPRWRAVQVESLRRKIDSLSDKASAYSYLGDLLMRDGMLDSAIADYKKTLEIEPDNASARCNLAVALTKQRRADEALVQFQECLKVRPYFVDAHRNLAHALIILGRVNEALAEFREAVRIDPGDALSQYSLGLTFARLNQMDLAIEHFGLAVRLRPTFPEAHCNLGVALTMRGRYLEAIARFREALRLRPDFPQAQDGLKNAQRLQSGR